MKIELRCSKQIPKPNAKLTVGYNTKSIRIKNYLDLNELQSGLQSGSRPRAVHVSARHTLFNTTKRITLLFIVQSLLHRNSPNLH